MLNRRVKRCMAGKSNFRLNLKVGAVVVVLRNLNTTKGLCNGIRLIVKQLNPNVIIAEVLTGSVFSKTVDIPLIDLTPTFIELHFTLNYSQGDFSKN